LNRQIIETIKQLKQIRNAVILAHNYQPGEVQDVADFVGDSLGLSRQAAETNADTIVFCGVLFMAETAAILSPDKTVLLPDKYAGCPLADMITAQQLREFKDEHPDAIVVCYVNSTVEVKALSDYCCTSANAVDIVNSLPEDKQIIFVPDKHLGRFVKDQTDRDILLWPGYCSTHVQITARQIQKAKARYPHAVVMCHPECTQPVRALSDQVLSTGQMLNFAKSSNTAEFIIATEIGIIHTLKKQNPRKQFVAASDTAICPDMKRITLEKIAESLENMQYKITIADDVRTKASRALERMVKTLPAKLKTVNQEARTKN